jgi:hypothetical protein
MYCLCLFFCGCESEPPETIRVRGTVTFQGGPAPAPGWIQFQPIEAAPGYSMRPGSGQFDTNGKFEATSRAKNDGLVPGRYRVQIECWRTEPDELTGSPGVSYVPEDFVPDELDVKPDASSITVDYDVPTGP